MTASAFAADSLSEISLGETRPTIARDRLFAFGPESLTVAELVSILLERPGARPGGTAVSEALLADGLDQFLRRDYTTRARIRALGRDRAARIAALKEFAIRLPRETLGDRPYLRDVEQSTRYVRSPASTWNEERVHAAFLDSRFRLIVDREIVRGSLDSASISPRDVLRHALLENASGVVLYHNHPSGDPTPSTDDITFTRQLAAASKQVGVKLLDHLVVGYGGVTSLKHRAVLE